MCGIVAYVGPREAYPVILKGLKRLEYRGYDSAGVALLNSGLKVYKKKGKVAELEEALVGKDLHAIIGIGHTRWATHGEPNDRNAHPHLSASGKLAMIHNGIIENYSQLKQDLTKRGYDHFMLKEIFEQPSTIYDCLRGRLDAEAGTITMKGIEEYAGQIMNA